MKLYDWGGGVGVGGQLFKLYDGISYHEHVKSSSSSSVLVILIQPPSQAIRGAPLIISFVATRRAL